MRGCREGKVTHRAWHVSGRTERRPSTDMERENHTGTKWELPCTLLLLPFVLSIVIVRAGWSLVLHVLVWIFWLPRGRDVLFVHSDSDHWKDFIDSEILPHIRHRAVVLNWSERRKWLGSMSLGPMLFRRFGGGRDFNPMGIRFRPFRPRRIYRFRKPILTWTEHGVRTELDGLLDRFRDDLGG